MPWRFPVEPDHLLSQYCSALYDGLPGAKQLKSYKSIWTADTMALSYKMLGLSACILLFN